MENTKSSNIGNLEISEDVISSIAQLVTNDIDGVGEIVRKNKNFYELIFKPKHSLLGIKPLSDAIEISICVKIKYGYKVKTVAEKIQENIKANVQNMAGITVSKVNVHVVDIMLEKSDK